MKAQRISPSTGSGVAVAPAAPAHRGRRQWLRSTLATVLGAAGTASLCGACAPVLPTAEAAARRPQRRHVAIAAQPADQVAPGVWVWRGQTGEVAPANRGRIANLGFIAGERGVLAIDSGVSHTQGQALMRSIALASHAPLRALVLTHVRQEFVFGATAFVQAGVPIVMHARAAQMMAARCAHCLETLQSVLGLTEMAGSEVVTPGFVFDSDQAPATTFGDLGRAVKVMLPGGIAHSSGLGDCVVWDAHTRTLFAGGLLDQQSIPDIQDADLDGWRRAWAALRQMQPACIVPGHGPVALGEAACQALISSNEDYLLQLSTLCERLVRSGVPLSEVADAVHLPQYAHWEQYDTIHRRNASIMYLKHERALPMQ